MAEQLAGKTKIIHKATAGGDSLSFVNLLKVHRELLVNQIRNTQCLIDNLIKNDYFSIEDAEIAVQYHTQADKVQYIFYFSLWLKGSLINKPGWFSNKSWLSILYKLSLLTIIHMGK